MKQDLSLKTKTDLPATMALTIVLWLCSLILIGLVVAPLFGAKVAWIVAIGLLVAFLVLCWGVCAYRLVVHTGHEPQR
jgi:hypothetical protein